MTASRSNCMDPVKNDVSEALELIHQIKKHRTPPEIANDPYCIRNPWPKLGGFSSAICMQWNWYHDTYILEFAEMDDLRAALREFEKQGEC